MQRRCVVPFHEKMQKQTRLQHPQPRGSPERATKLPPKSLFEVRSIFAVAWLRLGARALACAPGTFNCAVNTERGSPCKGWAKKILPEEKRKVEIFFRPACEALAGGKKAFKAARKRTPLSRPHTHNCPGTLYRSRKPKTKHLKSG